MSRIIVTYSNVYINLSPLSLIRHEIANICFAAVALWMS